MIFTIGQITCIPKRCPCLSVIGGNFNVTISIRASVYPKIPKHQISGGGNKLMGYQPLILWQHIPHNKCLKVPINGSNCYIREIYRTILLPGEFPIHTRLLNLSVVINNSVPAGRRIISLETFLPCVASWLWCPGEQSLTRIQSFSLNIQTVGCPNQIHHRNIQGCVLIEYQGKFLDLEILLVHIHIVFASI